MGPLSWNLKWRHHTVQMDRYCQTRHKSHCHSYIYVVVWTTHANIQKWSEMELVGLMIFQHLIQTKLNGLDQRQHSFESSPIPPTRFVNTVATVFCKTICQYWYYTHTYCQWQFATVSTQYVNVVAAVFETLPGTTYLKALPPQKEQNSCSIFTKCQKHPNGYYDGISRNISVFKEQIKMHATLKQPNCWRWKERRMREHLKNCYHHWEGELAETLWEFRQFFPREIMGENCSGKSLEITGRPRD